MSVDHSYLWRWARTPASLSIRFSVRSLSSRRCSWRRTESHSTNSHTIRSNRNGAVHVRMGSNSEIDLCLLFFLAPLLCLQGIFPERNASQSGATGFRRDLLSRSVRRNGRHASRCFDHLRSSGARLRQYCCVSEHSQVRATTRSEEKRIDRCLVCVPGWSMPLGRMPIERNGFLG